MSNGFPIQRSRFSVEGSTSPTGNIRDGVKGQPLTPEQRAAKSVPIVFPKGQTLLTGRRPPDELTIEEQRIYLASIAGAFRLFNASGNRKQLPANQPIRLSNATSFVKYVHVEPIFGFTGVVIFSSSEKGSRNTSIALKLPDDGAFRAILLPREELWGVGETAIDLKILETTI